MSDREAFLSAIRENPRDPAVRAVFADWLDDHDEPEEADFYRSWSLEDHLLAEEWLGGFAVDLGISYEQALKAGHDYLDSEKYFYLSKETPDRVYVDRKKFWQKFQLVTGRRIPPDREDFLRYKPIPYRCAC